MRKARWRHGLPAFLVGVALALGAQVSAGLLLYGGPGFLPALAIVLATASLALGAGLAAPTRASGSGGEGIGRRWSAEVPTPALAPHDVEGARRRWLALLLAFTAAAFFAGGWEIFRGFGARGLTQGAGLAVLLALPMYAGGRVLAAHALRLPVSPPPERGGWGSAPWALAGAAAGFLALAFVFFPMLSPTAVLLFCVVATSGGALVHGWLLDEVAQVEVECFAGGAARIRWRRARPREARVVWVAESGEAVFRGGNGEPVTLHEQAVEGGILPRLGAPERVMALGWTSLPIALSISPRPAGITVVDPEARRVHWLASELLDDEETPLITPRDHPVQEWLASGDDPLVDLVVAAGVPLAGALSGETAGATWAALHDRVRPGGSVIVHGLHEGAGGTGLLAPLRAAAFVFGDCAAYVGPEDASAPGAGGRPGFLVCRRSGAVEPMEDGSANALPDHAGAFTRVSHGAPAEEPHPDPGMAGGKRA